MIQRNCRNRLLTPQDRRFQVLLYVYRLLVGQDDNRIVGDGDPPSLDVYDYTGSVFPQFPGFFPGPKTIFIVMLVILPAIVVLNVALSKLCK
jgi:hypothetical protein